METHVTGAASEIAGWLSAREDEMAETLERLVAIESPSGWGPGLARAAEAIADELSASGLRPRIRADSTNAHVLARRADRFRSRSKQLILGHLDTVWPVGTLERMPIRSSDGKLYGPGAFDMKGGIVQLVFALRALDAAGVVPPAEPVVLVTGDEEVGSHGSRPLIARLARLARRAFVLEPSFGPRGALKVARKGIGRYEIRIRGLAAHAGLEPGAGISAIVEASHQIQRIDALNDQEHGVTVNVGTVEGGLRPNVVAPEATIVIEARAPRIEDAERVDEALRALAPVTAGAEVHVTGGFGRPPMEQTPAAARLLTLAQEAARALGTSVEGEAVGGASDGNLIAGLVPVLDGLGAVGAGAHADNEHVVVADLPVRAALLALLLASPITATAPSGAA
jgi:glutamate carboxypeptidase